MKHLSLFDPLFVDFFNNFNFDFESFVSASTYPPYNLLVNGEDVLIEMAVAGFDKERLSISIENGYLIIKGKELPVPPKDQKYVHRGIANRAFTQKFDLQDKLKVGDIALRDGMLQIILHRIVPDRSKPRELEIKSSDVDFKNLLGLTSS